MPTMEQITIDALFAMLKGEPGTRKSTQALSFPKPQYWVSTDRKMEALKLPMNAWGVSPRDIEYDDFTDWDRPKSKLEGFKVNCKYKTLIIDSVTSIGDNMTGQVKGLKRQKGEGKIIGNINVSGLEEYNAESSAFQELIAILKDVHSYHKCNVVLIAHVIGQRKQDPANQLTHHSRVIITGGEKISGKIASYMTEVYHFNVDPGFQEGQARYSIWTTHTGNDYARTALPLPSKIEFNDSQLYGQWIRPAIDKLNKETPVHTIVPKTTQQTDNKTTNNLTPFTR